MANPNFSQPVRLRYLEAVLYTHGKANSTTLVSIGVTRQQASLDIDEYLRLAGPVMVYRPSLKTWTLDRRRRPCLLNTDDHNAYIRAVEHILRLTPDNQQEEP